ncbi:hypothetical protein LINPERPRIM_LOCUS8570 [Linum perenne]
MKEYRIPNIVDRKWNGRLRKETIIHRLITQSHIYYEQQLFLACFLSCHLVPSTAAASPGEINNPTNFGTLSIIKRNCFIVDHLIEFWHLSPDQLEGGDTCLHGRKVLIQPHKLKPSSLRLFQRSVSYVLACK